MIPAECDLEQRPLSEQIVFNAIKKYLSKEWKVFHAFDYISRDKENKIFDGEIDFLLYLPDHGFIVIEVKGGQISHKDGQWLQDGHKIDPVKQACKNKYAVLELLQQRLGKAIPLKFAHAVCFPSCEQQPIWPVEAKDIVLTKSELPQLEFFARQLLAATAIPNNIGGFISDPEIMCVLNPIFEYGTRMSQKISAEQFCVEEECFFHLTEQQCSLLSSLEQFRRMTICGCAGSGKTIMAIKKAKQLADQGKKVLLLCYNQLLAKYLKNSVAEYPEIQAVAFFDFCIELLQIPDEKLEGCKTHPQLYSNLLPKFLRTYIAKTCLYYDAVIVDEGQDFTKEAWDVISLLPEENGYFYVFYDENQNIYNKDLYLPDFGYPSFILNKNCRNTKNIFDRLQPYQSAANRIMENAPQGADVRTYHGDVRKHLAQELTRLMIDEKIQPEDIVILGGHLLEHTLLGVNPQVGDFRVVSTEQPLQDGEVRYFTYMKYKGCESKIVILLDVDDNDPRWNDRGIYTAMSRAVHELIILYLK